MKHASLLPTLLLSGLVCSLPVLAQEKGAWRASSTTARSITGDLIFSGQKLSINFSSFTVAQIRDLTPAELTAAFSAEPDARGSGNLYRLSIPAAKTFLHRNTLCGSEDTQWIATYVSGHNLQLAMFSGTQMPVFTAEALNNPTSLCGTYSYVR